MEPSPYFEPNRGQADPSAAFIARGPAYAVLLRQTGDAEYRFPGAPVAATPLSVEFVGLQMPTEVTGEQPLPSVTNYYGGASGNWLSAIPHFQRVKFREIYPGIDLMWQVQGPDLEYEFLAAAGTDPSGIQIGFAGARRVWIDGQQNLILESPYGRVQHRRPRAWQEFGGRRHEVDIALRLNGKTAHFQLGDYDRRLPLWIDPVLAYSTYVGGAGYDAGYAIKVDGSGGVYITGTTASIGFPDQGSGANGYGEAFVMKFNESGTLLYNTIFATNGNTAGQAIAVDTSGNAYVAGTTQAANFPATPGAWQKAFGGVADAFAAKLNSAGQLVYATYIGGAGQETGTGIAIDSSGNAYISGYTSSVFPTTRGAAQTLYGGGFSDAFLVKLNPLGSAAIYSTLLGGTGTDLAEAVVVDGAGRACIAGYTDSVNLTVYAAVQPLPGGEGDALIACLSADGTAWTMVSYLGGSDLDQAYALAIDASGNLYVAGTTYSADFPVTSGVLQPVNAGGYDAFVAKLSPGGIALTFASFLGGNGSDAALAITTGSSGDIWVGGYTLSTNFPLSEAWQSAPAGSFDGFISHLNPAATALLTSSYLGGTGDDRVLGIALDTAGLVFATGSTLSANFPVTPGAMQDLAPAGVNAFLVNVMPSANTISGQITCGGSPMSGVTVSLSGSQNTSAITNNTGFYSFTVADGGNYVLTPSLSGYSFGPGSQSYSNLNTNQTVNFTASAGPSYSISGQVIASSGALGGVTMTLGGSQTGTSITDASGNYSFTVAAGGNYTVAPSMPGAIFSPATLTITDVTANQPGANFAASTIASAVRFISMPPCRVVDTRIASQPPGFGPPSLVGAATRSFSLTTGPCGIPSTAQAYSLNVTVVPQGTLGYITVWPTGQSQPVVSTLNSIDGQVQANAAIVAAGTGSAINVFATNNTDLVLDVNGYFVADTVPNGLGFYPLPPCRLVDTRAGATSSIITGTLAGGSNTTLPILSGTCNVPSSAQAYSLNFTLVPPGVVDYLTVYPTGESLPTVSTMNDPTGVVEANAAIVPAGTGGGINVFVTQATDLVVDINGYFAPVGPGALSLYALPPCRVLDTRLPAGSPPFEGTIAVNVGSNCRASGSAQAYVFNATVVPQGMLGYLTLWPQGSKQPVVSTLNAYNGAMTSNMAIVPTSNSTISAYATSNTYLVLDLFGYFAP